MDTKTTAGLERSWLDSIEGAICTIDGRFLVVDLLKPHWGLGDFESQIFYSELFILSRFGFHSVHILTVFNGEDTDAFHGDQKQCNQVHLTTPFNVPTYQ